MLQFLLITFHSLIPLTVNWKLIQRKRTEYFSIPQLNLINILIQIIVNPIPAFNTISLLFSLRARNSNEIVSFTRRVLACLRPFQFLWINLRDSSSVEKKKANVRDAVVFFFNGTIPSTFSREAGNFGWLVYRRESFRPRLQKYPNRSKGERSSLSLLLDSMWRIRGRKFSKSFANSSSATLGSVQQRRTRA